MKVDVIVDILAGDCGKGCVSAFLCSQKDFFGNSKYTHCLRFGGGGNCGHSIYINNKKIITHIIPSGIIYPQITAMIGPQVVFNINKLFEEIKYLESAGITDCRKRLKIAYNAHIVTEEHLDEEKNEIKIGSTRQGVTPAIRDKYNRCGISAKDVHELRPFVVDIYDEFYNKKNIKIIAEGHQGYFLDINNWSMNYPYVTSSHCLSGSVTLNGIPPKSIDKIYGVAKPYFTYVGNLKIQPEGETVFKQIQDIGNEKGSTTGRLRQVNWLDVDMAKRASDMNGCTHLIINKMDILKKVGVWKVYEGGSLIDLKTEENFKKLIKSKFKGLKITFSYRPDGV